MHNNSTIMMKISCFVFIVTLSFLILNDYIKWLEVILYMSLYISSVTKIISYEINFKV